MSWAFTHLSERAYKYIIVYMLRTSTRNSCIL